MAAILQAPLFNGRETPEPRYMDREPRSLDREPRSLDRAILAGGGQVGWGIFSVVRA
jgi:hypothetical protein